MNWRVYYDSGSYCDGRDVTPQNLPRLGVQVIVQEDSSRSNGWDVVRMYDYYLWKDGYWYGADIFGLFDYLQTPRNSTVVLFGRTIDRERYNDVVQRAIQYTLETKVK